jgi:hypothetical protein
MGNGRPSLTTLLRQAGQVLLVLLISFVFGEVALRLVHRVYPTFVYYDDSYNRFRGKPGSEFRGHPLNELGFNDVTFEREKGDRFRIVALGDSFAFGVVPYTNNYLTMLERKLNRTHPPVDVLNMGIPRTGPVEQLGLLLREGLSFDPDLVLISFFVGNDFLDVRRAARKEKSLADRSYVLSLLYYAVMVRPRVEPSQIYGRREYQDDAPTLGERAFLEIVARRGVVFRTDWAEFSEAFDLAVGTLQEIRRVCDQHGVDLSVVLIPEEVQLDPTLQESLIAGFAQYRRENTDFERPNRLLAQRLHELGFDVLDLYPRFAEKTNSQRLYKPRDTHWNIAGNRLAASEIAHHLVETRFNRPPSEQDAIPPKSARELLTSPSEAARVRQ